MLESKDLQNKLTKLHPPKQGYLKKNSPKFLVGYQKRWVTVEDREMRYYKEDKTGRKLCGVINFDLYQV